MVAKCVALTFDDGHGPKTDKVLDTLKDGGAPSTFFVTGPNAMLRSGLLVRMAAEGHEIGNHTWNHRSLASMSSAQIQREIGRTNVAITAAIEQPATLLRPPYGSHNSISDRLASTPVILWDVDTLDWKHRDTVTPKSSSTPLFPRHHRAQSCSCMTSVPPPWLRCPGYCRAFALRATRSSPSAS